MPTRSRPTATPAARSMARRRRARRRRLVRRPASSASSSATASASLRCAGGTERSQLQIADPDLPREVADERPPADPQERAAGLLRARRRRARQQPRRARGVRTVYEQTMDRTGRRRALLLCRRVLRRRAGERSAPGCSCRRARRRGRRRLDRRAQRRLSALLPQRNRRRAPARRADEEPARGDGQISPTSSASR